MERTRTAATLGPSFVGCAGGLGPFGMRPGRANAVRGTCVRVGARRAQGQDEDEGQPHTVGYAWRWRRSESPVFQRTPRPRRLQTRHIPGI